MSEGKSFVTAGNFLQTYRNHYQMEVKAHMTRIQSGTLSQSPYIMAVLSMHSAYGSSTRYPLKHNKYQNYYWARIKEMKKNAFLQVYYISENQVSQLNTPELTFREKINQTSVIIFIN